MESHVKHFLMFNCKLILRTKIMKVKIILDLFLAKAVEDLEIHRSKLNKCNMSSLLKES